MTTFHVADHPRPHDRCDLDDQTPDEDPHLRLAAGPHDQSKPAESKWTNLVATEDHHILPDNDFLTTDLTISRYNDSHDIDEGTDDNVVPLDSPTYSSSSDESPFHRFPLSPVVKYSSFANKVAAVLDMYDQEFCILPLSEDVRSNPFRVHRNDCEGSAFLLHAVLALASQHLAKKNNSAEMVTQMHNHQATAVKLFSEAVAYTPAFTALDTLLLLVNFEATQTASSTWGVHLGGAFNIIESIGIDIVCQRSSRTRAQIAMLVWWDVTIALISRKAPRFPARYLETLLKYSGEDGWSWVSLNGCPADLVAFMARLARLAATYEKVLDMEWTSFDHTPVRQIISAVRSWKNPDESASAIDDFEADNSEGIERTQNEEPNFQLNRMHCVEAWRQSILLYAHRVFFRPTRPQPTSGASSANSLSESQRQSRRRIITILSRKVLDHVRCIPSSAIMQKQTLLPIFLAAAEVTSFSFPSEVGREASRDFARTYCRHWTATARYDMFTTVGTLLERVWADADASEVGVDDDNSGKEEFWWGCTVGQTTDFTSPSSAGPSTMSPFSDGDDDGSGGLLVSELLLG